jgi:serine/threonine-protein kinase/endoribonuclease IRE1
MLISDFGLCKKLESDETSFLPTRHGPMGAGTVGWRAPEILRGEVKLDEQSVDVSTSTDGRDDSSTIGSVGTASGGPTAPRTRLTKSVDIFALGCLYYYTLSGGDHPYGGPFDREANILKNEKSLDWLDNLGEEGAEAVDLITQMLHPNPRERYVSPYVHANKS